MFDTLFTGEGLLFSIPAVVGSVVFLLKIGLMSLGGFGTDAEFDIDTDVDVDLGEDAHDSTHAFSLLSVQSIAAMFMGFGWGGLTARFAMEWSITLSVLSGVGVAALMVWVLALMMKAMYDMQSSGNVHLEDTIGLRGNVYLTVPANGDGRGRVRLVVGQRARIFDAITAGEAITKNTTVRVISANDDNTLTVAPA